MAGISELLRRARAREAMGKGGAATHRRVDQANTRTVRPNSRGVISDAGQAPADVGSHAHEALLDAARGSLFALAGKRVLSGQQVSSATQRRLAQGGGFLGPQTIESVRQWSPETRAAVEMYGKRLGARTNNPRYRF